MVNGKRADLIAARVDGEHELAAVRDAYLALRVEERAAARTSWLCLLAAVAAGVDRLMELEASIAVTVEYEQLVGRAVRL